MVENGGGHPPPDTQPPPAHGQTLPLGGAGRVGEARTADAEPAARVEGARRVASGFRSGASSPGDGLAGQDIERGRGTRGRRSLVPEAAGETEPEMATRAAGRDPERAWRRLREHPDYVADWRASAGPPLREAPPYAFRRQTEADLKAARWNLLAWEDPRYPRWAELFWADMPAVEARATDPGTSGEHA